MRLRSSKTTVRHRKLQTLPWERSGQESEQKADTTIELSESQRLSASAATLSRLVYLSRHAAHAQLAHLGATRIARISDSRGSTVGDCCVLDGRAWIVFRGSNDWNDWARNGLWVPFYHIGFHRCFDDVRFDLRLWTDPIRDQDLKICLAGHSLGGAIATIAAKWLAADGHSVETLRTFGAPRVYSPWESSRFNSIKTNEGQLGDQTLRFRSDREIVTQFPFFFLGFRHVGERARFPNPGFGRGAGQLHSARLLYRSTTPYSPVPGSAEGALHQVGQLNLGGLEFLFKAGAQGIRSASYHDMALYHAMARANDVHQIDWSNLEDDDSQSAVPIRVGSVLVLLFYVLLAIAICGGFFYLLDASMGEAGFTLLALGVLLVVLQYWSAKN